MAAQPALAADDPPSVKGFYIVSDYPTVSVKPGTVSNITLHIQNYAMAPERLALSVSGVPTGWKATLIGGGQPIGAAMPAPGSNVAVELRLDIPKNASVSSSQTLTVTAEGANTKTSLPIAVSLAKELPAKLSLQSQLPDLRGSSKSNFEYTLSIKNDSGKRLLVSLAAQAPDNFDTSFTEAYGTQELSAIPVDAGQSKDVKLKVRPPNSVKAGHYAVTARVAAEDASAETRIALDITGQPKLTVSGREGLLSATATAGKQSSVPVVISNDGTAPAENIDLAGTAPNGWKVEFDPKKVSSIAPGEQKEVQALVTPVANAIAGDYVVNVRATTKSDSASQTFRTAVTTSNTWGIAGFGLIGAALLVLVGAVARFGRR